MVIEQAFAGLPESLVGNSYREQEYEAGVVAAFSHSMLQELNGRNVPNPISLVFAERVYDSTGFLVNNERHYWRADLHVNLLPVRSGSNRLERYGFRFSNWLEAKFFRKRQADPGQQDTNKTKSTGDLLIDLLRLTCLVPLEIDRDGKTFSGRYLLHVHDDEPQFRVSLNYRDGTDKPRHWLKALTTQGTQSFASLELDRDDAMRGHVGDGMQQLQLAVQVTTLAIEPVVSRVAGEKRLYWCYLSRIDKITAAWGGAKWEMGSDRVIKESTKGDHEVVRQAVAAELVGRSDEGPAPGPEDLDDARRAEERSGRLAELDPYQPTPDPFNPE